MDSFKEFLKESSKTWGVVPSKIKTEIDRILSLDNKHKGKSALVTLETMGEEVLKLIPDSIKWHEKTIKGYQREIKKDIKSGNEKAIQLWNKKIDFFTNQKEQLRNIRKRLKKIKDFDSMFSGLNDFLKLIKA